MAVATGIGPRDPAHKGCKHDRHAESIASTSELIRACRESLEPRLESVTCSMGVCFVHNLHLLLSKSMPAMEEVIPADAEPTSWTPAASSRVDAVRSMPVKFLLRICSTLFEREIRSHEPSRSHNRGYGPPTLYVSSHNRIQQQPPVVGLSLWFCGCLRDRIPVLDASGGQEQTCDHLEH